MLQGTQNCPVLCSWRTESPISLLVTLHAVLTCAYGEITCFRFCISVRQPLSDIQEIFKFIKFFAFSILG